MAVCDPDGVFLPGFRFKARRHITLALDATTLREDFWLLAVSVSYRGRAIPIYLRSWAGVNTCYDYWGRVEQVLGELKALLPESYPFELVADRGFQGENMLTILDKVGWGYSIRVNGDYHIRKAGEEAFVPVTRLADGWYEAVTLGKTARGGPVNLAVSTAEGGARWYLMSNLSERAQAIDSYRQRFWIEETFKDLKSKLRWESYTRKVPTRGRLGKCIAISCLSYAIQTALGTQITLSASEQRKTSVFNRFRQAFRRTNQKLQQIITRVISIISTYLRRTKMAFT